MEAGFNHTVLGLLMQGAEAVAVFYELTPAAEVFSRLFKGLWSHYDAQTVTSGPTKLHIAGGPA